MDRDKLCCNCSLGRKDCSYFNVKRIENGKGKDCPFWTPIRKIGQSLFEREVYRKLNLI